MGPSEFLLFPLRALDPRRKTCRSLQGKLLKLCRCGWVGGLRVLLFVPLELGSFWGGLHRDKPQAQVGWAAPGFVLVLDGHCHAPAKKCGFTADLSCSVSFNQTHGIGSKQGTQNVNPDWFRYGTLWKIGILASQLVIFTRGTSSETKQKTVLSWSTHAKCISQHT